MLSCDCLGFLALVARPFMMNSARSVAQETSRQICSTVWPEACLCVVLWLAWFPTVNVLEDVTACTYCTFASTSVENQCTCFCVGKCIHGSYGIHDFNECHSLSPLSLSLFCIAYLKSLYPWWWPVSSSHYVYYLGDFLLYSLFTVLVCMCFHCSSTSRDYVFMHSGFHSVVLCD